MKRYASTVSTCITTDKSPSSSPVLEMESRLTRTMLRRLRSSYDGSVFRTEIRVNVRLAEAPALGQTIFQYDPGATGAQAYRRLARETVRRAAEMVASRG